MPSSVPSQPAFSPHRVPEAGSAPDVGSGGGLVLSRTHHHAPGGGGRAAASTSQHWVFAHRGLGEPEGPVAGRFAQGYSSQGGGALVIANLRGPLDGLSAPLGGAVAAGGQAEAAADERDGGNARGAPPSVWLDPSGRVSAGGFGPSAGAALSVGGSLTAFDVVLAADDRLLGGGPGAALDQGAKALLGPRAAAASLALLEALDLAACHWPANQPPANQALPGGDKAYDARRRLGHHFGAASSIGRQPGLAASSDDGGGGFLCASAQQVEAAATAGRVASDAARAEVKALGPAAARTHADDAGGRAWERAFGATAGADAPDGGVGESMLLQKDDAAALLGASLVHTDTDGFKGISVGRLALVLASAAKEQSARHERLRDAVGGLRQSNNAALAALVAKVGALSDELWALAAQEDEREAAIAAERKAAASARAAEDTAAATAAAAAAKADAATASLAALEARVKAAEATAEDLRLALSKANSGAATAAVDAAAAATAAVSALRADLTEQIRVAAVAGRAQCDAATAKATEAATAAATAAAAQQATAAAASTGAAAAQQAAEAAAARHAELALLQAAARGGGGDVESLSPEASEAKRAAAESELLTRYFFDEVARAESAIRAARSVEARTECDRAAMMPSSSSSSDSSSSSSSSSSSGQCDGPLAAALAPLSPADREAARALAMAAVTERKADLQKLRELGL